MGADLADKSANARQKSRDRAKALLATPSLLTIYPAMVGSSTTADLVGNASSSVGDKVLLQVCDNNLYAMIGNDRIARFDDPPENLLCAIKNCHGIGEGEVTKVHKLSRKIQVRLTNDFLNGVKKPKEK